jgi:hypothetical protein
MPSTSCWLAGLLVVARIDAFTGSRSRSKSVSPPRETPTCPPWISSFSITTTTRTCPSNLYLVAKKDREQDWNADTADSSDMVVAKSLDDDVGTDLQDDQQTYRINLQIGQLAASSSRRNPRAGRSAYELLRTLPDPDTVSYNSCLNALAKTSSRHAGSAATLSQELLQEMEELHVLQTKANQLWYQKNHDGMLADDELSMGPPRIRVKPNVRTYSTVMDAWGRQGTRDGACAAQALLDRLASKYQATQDFALQPNAISYNTVMNAWAKAGAKEEGALQCEALLDDMGNLSDVISYNAVLHAWARSGAPDAGNRAETILRDMWHVQPNGRTYTTVMDAWSRSHGCEDSAARAYELLLESEEIAEREGDDNMKPNCISYATVINAYALSKTEPFKAHKAFRLLQRMNKNPDIRPNHVAYNSVLNACATSCPNAYQENLQRLPQDPANHMTLPDMVRTLYQQLIDDNDNDNDNPQGASSPPPYPHLQPDHYTFGTVLKAIANLFWGEPDQVEFCQQVFQEACNRGQVTFGVLFQLRQAAPSEVYRQMLPKNAYNPENGHFNMQNIPKDWTKNVRDDSRRKNQQGTNYQPPRRKWKSN